MDGWRKRDFDHIERDGGFRTPRGYRDDCQPKMSELPRRESSPIKHLSSPRVRDRGVRTNHAPMSYANSGMALPYRTSVHHNSCPGGQGFRPALSGRGRAENKYFESHEFVSPANNVHCLQYNNARSHEHRLQAGGLRGPGNRYGTHRDYSLPSCQTGPPPYRVGQPGRFEMMNGLSRYW